MAYQGGYATGYVGYVDSLVLPETTFRPSAAGYGARIADYWVRLAPSREAPLRMYTQDSLAPRHDDRSSTDENVLEIGHAFSRTDLTGGAGLDKYPRPLSQEREAEDNIRFWDSMNVDIGRSRYDIEYAWRLHRKLEEWDASTGDVTAIVRTSDLLFVAAGNFVYWYDTLGNTTAEGSQNIGNPIDAMCVIGDEAFLLSNNVVQRKTAAAGAFTTWHTPAGGETIERIWAVKNRIMAHRTGTSMNELVDLADGTTEVKIDDFADGVSVNQVIDAGPVILAALDSGIFYSYVFDDTATPDLVPKSQTPVPIGENPISVAYNQGTLLYMTIDPATAGSTTVARIYAGEILDSRFNNTVGNSQLIFEWDSSITAARTNTSELVALRDDIWWVMYEPDVAGDKYVSMYRYDLVTRGYNRAHAVAVSAATDPGELVMFEDRMVFANDDDVWAEAASTYADVGWLMTPMVNFGLNTAINWVATTLDAIDVESGGLQIELLRATDPAALQDWEDSSWITEQRITSPYQTAVEIPMINIEANQMALQARLYPNAAGTPGVRKAALRGLPSHRDLIVELPVNISDMVEVPFRAPSRTFRLGDKVHNRLFNFSGKHVEVLVLDPPMTVVGIVDQIAEPVSYLTARGSQGQMCMVRIRGQRIPLSSPTAPDQPGETPGTPPSYGTAGLGIGLLGVATIGIGQSTEIS